MEVALGAQVGLEVGDRLLRKLHVEQYGLLANLTLEVIPPVILLGVGVLIHPDIEVDAEEALVGRLTDIYIDAILVYRDTLVARCGLILLELDLRHEVLALGEVARDIAADNRKCYQQQCYVCNHSPVHMALYYLFRLSTNSVHLSASPVVWRMS